MNVSFRARIIDVVYNASDNELLRTKTLVKNCIISVDATCLKSQLEKSCKDSGNAMAEIDSQIKSQIDKGRVLACVSSRPGQIGKCDGYVLEGPELHFYQKKIHKKSAKKM